MSLNVCFVCDVDGCESEYKEEGNTLDSNFLPVDWYHDKDFDSFYCPSCFSELILGNIDESKIHTEEKKLRAFANKGSCIAGYAPQAPCYCHGCWNPSTDSLWAKCGIVVAMLAIALVIISYH